MCFASPNPQKDPSRPANYTVDQNYGQVTSSSVDRDGNVTGGDTIANTNIKMGAASKTPKVVGTPDPNGPRRAAPTRRAYMGAGANVRM